MESLNYTQLASVVLVLSVASLLLFIISLILVLSIRKQKKAAKKIDKRVDYFAEKIGEVSRYQIDIIEKFENKINNDLLIQKKNIYDHLEARINTLFKPAYAIGEKVETTDGIKGTITHISKDKDGFMYEITERSYFNRPSKKHNRIEFLLMKA